MQPTSKDLSIVIPVYNALDVLPRCIDSILDQTADLSRVEVLLVDDGSTDGSGALCDDYARERPDLFRVIHQENSGGPASPRNQGIRAARGTYVFFCDNDDYFGVEAVERMLAHAFEWDSDVLVCRCGRTSRSWGFYGIFDDGNQPEVDLYDSNTFFFLTPWKLYRRSFLSECEIRFPEDCSLDDMVFSVESYLRARVVSLAGDYDYYFWTSREDGVNLSDAVDNSFWYDIDRRLRGSERCLALLDEHGDIGCDASRLYYRILSGSTFNTLLLIGKSQKELMPRYFAKARALLAPYCTEAHLRYFGGPQRVVFRCLVEGEDPECFAAMASSYTRGVGAFGFVEGQYRCECAIEGGIACNACDALVAEEVDRIARLRQKPADQLSDKERKDLACLAKHEAKVKMEGSCFGRMALRLARTDVARRVLRPLKRKLFA